MALAEWATYSGYKTTLITNFIFNMNNEEDVNPWIEFGAHVMVFYRHHNEEENNEDLNNVEMFKQLYNDLEVRQAKATR
jgi:hypothetical protein